MEEYRKEWAEARFRNEGIGSENKNMFDFKRMTALERLANRYRRFAIFALLMTLWFPLLGTRQIFADQTLRMIVTIYSAAYFLIISTIDWTLYRGIRKIDCTTMSVSTVAEMARRYRRIHLRTVMALIPLAVVFVWLILLANDGSEYYTAGVVVGGVLGLAIGTVQLLKFLRDYRDID